MTDLRCPSKKHGELQDDVLEVKCGSRFCGATDGAVVIHQFDAGSGELLGTLVFKDPIMKGTEDASSHRAAVRPA